MLKQLFINSFAITSLCAVQSVCLAQGNGGDSNEITNWWQVEIIMFTQGSNWATTTEVWPTDIELHYPDQWQQLTPLVDPNADAPDGENKIEDAADQAVAAEDDFLDPGLLKLLPEDELQLTDMRKQLNRGRRRILFHGAWRQYMERDQEEAPIIFAAGDQYDDHYELEGSIHLYVQRLLHFDVNLWFTEFSINTGQERRPWPELPKRPNQDLPQNGPADSPTPLLHQRDQSPNQTQNGSLPAGTFINPNSGAINTLDWFDQRGNTTFYDSRYDEILSRNYVVNNLALIQEDRPMRSNELHYIDHPLVGILVKIDRYQPPEPEGVEADPLDALLGPKPQ